MWTIREADVQNSIRLALVPYAVIFRINTGKVKMEDGRWFDTGVPRGFSDLFGYRLSDNKAVFLEIKNEKGKASKEQLHFIKTMNEKGAIAGVVRSVDEAMELINR